MIIWAMSNMTGLAATAAMRARAKTVLTDIKPVEPQIVRKRQRRLCGLDPLR